MSWASSQMVPDERNALPPPATKDITLRQVVRLSIGGKKIRVQLSNAFGIAPLAIAAAGVAPAALPASSEIASDAQRTLTFNGQEQVTVPAGASIWSDPIALDVASLASMAVSIHLLEAPTFQTSHPGSRATSYWVKGNHVHDVSLPHAETVTHWYLIAGVAVDGRRSSRAVVAFGDSITDGYGATTDGNNRWTDMLAERLNKRARYREIAVLNHGIGGNRLLLDGTGPNAVARFDRDVLAQLGVRYLIVFEGVNDLGMLTRDAPASAQEHADLVNRMIGAYQQMIDRAHAAGIRVYGATILPFGASAYYHPDEANETDRLAVNRWIRESGRFDGVIDFDKALRDPKDSRKLNPAYDSGDGLHPSVAGFRVMANLVPLNLFD